MGTGGAGRDRHFGAWINFGAPLASSVDAAQRKAKDMCDYSLMNLPNRLAKENEVLVSHRFVGGSIGFVSPADLRSAREILSKPRARGFWDWACAWFRFPSSPPVPAVCIPPGATLQALTLPCGIEKATGIRPGDEVTFNQITAEWGQYRDALCLEPNRPVLLQYLGEGAQFQIVTLDLRSERVLAPEYAYSLVPRR